MVQVARVTLINGAIMHIPVNCLVTSCVPQTTASGSERKVYAWVAGDDSEYPMEVSCIEFLDSHTAALGLFEDLTGGKFKVGG